MNTLHEEEFKQRIAAFTDEEKKEVLKTLSNELLIEELNHRLTELTDKMIQIKTILEWVRAK